MPKSHAVLRYLRLIHLYLGVFTAPMLLFFAITGALQTFNLHETTQGSSYKPSTFLMTMAQIHKKQTWMLPQRKSRSTETKPDAGKPDGTNPDTSKGDKVAASPTAPAPASPQAPQRSHLPLKIFFLLVSIGLFVTTLTGIYMAYKFNRSKLLITGLLLAGMVVPLVLLPY